MAHIVVSLTGSETLLDLITNRAGTHGVRAHLYKNNVAPPTDGSDVLANYTESTFSGYAFVLLSGWSAPASDGATPPRGTTTAAAAVFTRSVTGAGENVYGVYLTDAGGAFIGAWRDPAAGSVGVPTPIVLTNNGDNYSATVTLTQISEFTS